MTKLQTSRQFLASQKKALKKHAESKEHVQEVIDSLEDNPYIGELWPGFGGHSVRKMRIGLPESDISPRDGLRLAYYYSEAKDVVFPLVLKRKGAYKERDFLREVKKMLKDVLKE